MSEPTRRRRGRRWIKFGLLGVLGLAVLAVAAAALVVHTHWGKEQLRAQVEQRLNDTFIGGATLGGVEGSPFNDLTLHDVVINGPDRRPVIKARTLTVSVGILPLLSHQARILGVAADGLDVDLRRDANGELITKHLTRPGPPSAWSIDLPKVTLRNAHVQFDTGTEVMNFDGLSIDAWAHLPHGGPVDAGVDLHGAWRERQAAKLALSTIVHSDAVGVSSPYLIAHAGDVSIVANQVRVRTGAPPTDALASAPRVPVIGGSFFIDATAEAVARLVPTLHLPADFVVQVTASPMTHSTLTTVKLDGKVDQAPVTFTGTADLDARHVRGQLKSGALDITRLSGGKLAGRAAGTVELDVRPGGPAALPIASATIHGWGELAGAPRTALEVAVSSAGERARATIRAVGADLHAEIAANVHALGDALAIEAATIRARTSDPSRASGGKAPVHGALQVDLRASGALRPRPDLAIAGTVEGQRLRMQDLSVAVLHLAVDGQRIPDRPVGKAHVQLIDLVRANRQLGELTVDASDRSDGKIAVSVRSRPKQNPWLIDADALVTPPADLGRGRFAIDLVGHHVRAGSGADWYGRTGHIDIGPERIAVRDLTSKSKIGSLAVAATLQRAGAGAGDLAANVDVTELTLDNLTGALAGTYSGRVDAHVAVTRTRGAWQGDVRIDGRKLSYDPARVGPAKEAVAKADAEVSNEKAEAEHKQTAQGVAEVQAEKAEAAEADTPATSKPASGDATAATGDAQKPPAVTPTTTPPGNQKRSPLAPNSAPGAVAIGPDTQKPINPPDAKKIEAAKKAVRGEAPSVNPTQHPAIQPPKVAFDTQIHAGLHGRRLTVAANVTSDQVGSARLAIDADAPANVAAPAAWERLGRDAIRTAELTLRGVDVRRAAAMAGLAGDYAGSVNGNIQLTGTTTAGRIEVTNLGAPALRGLPVTAVLDLSQRSPREISPRLSVAAGGAGNATAQADLTMPERPFDPAAWKRLGRGALHGATVRSDNISIDPALLDRLGIVSQLHGKAGISVDISEAARTAQAVIEIGELRGGALSQPIDAKLTASLDERATTTALTVASKGKPLLQMTGRLPVSLAELLDRRSDPATLKATPVSATAKLAQTDAAQLFAVIGRTEITGGRLDGGIDLTGTIGAPKATVKLAATQLTIPPGPRGKPVRTVERLDISAVWDGTTARLDVNGRESAGGTLKLAGVVRPDRLRDGTVTIQAEKFDLVPLLVFAPGPAGGSSGELDANLRMVGLDLRTAQVAGELHLRDARIPTAPTIGTLRSAKIDAVVADHEVRIGVDGKLGAGSATVTGSIALDGAAPNGGKAKITLRKVSPIGTIEPEITADINATLSRDRNQWHAELVVDNGRVVVPKKRGEKLKPVGAPPDMVFANGQRATRRPMEHQEPTSPIFLVDIDLRTTKVESEEFRGLIRGKLQLRADGEALAMYGGIEADRGDLDLFSRRYYVERAAVRFDGSLDPLLDIRITHDFPEVTTVTEVRGRASKPELVMTSDPGTYSQGQLLGFLLGGEPGGDPQSGPLQSQVTGAGESYVANQIGGYVKKALPIDIDVLRYESATSTSSAAITVGSWINSSLFLSYRQHLESRPDENTGEAQIEYWLTRRLMIQGTAGDRNYDGVDLLWRKRY